MPYSTTANVRAEGGFEENTNVTDALIDGYIVQADAEIDATLTRVYVMPLSETPALIEFVSRQLAAGLLLEKEYGYDDGARDAGERKLENGRQLLKDLADKTKILLDSSNEQMTMVESGSIKFSPNAASTTERKFSMDQEF